MYGQQAPLLAQRPSLSAALASSETRPCPCCPTSPFIYNRFIGGYTITLILQWLSLIFLVAGTATPALFLLVTNGASLTYGLFHACRQTSVLRRCLTYEADNGQLFGTEHLGQQWAAFQALTVMLNVMSFAVAVLYTLRMVVVQRSKSLSRRAETGQMVAASFSLLLAFTSIVLFFNCYGSMSVSILSAYNVTKTLGSSFTLILAAYIMQMTALLFHTYTFVQHAKSTRNPSPATASPSRPHDPEPVPIGAMASPAALYHGGYMPAAAAAYQQQPAFYGQAYQLPQQYMQPGAAVGGGVPSYYAPPQYYAPAQPQPQQQMPAWGHAQPYPAAPVVHYGEPAQHPAATPQ